MAFHRSPIADVPASIGAGLAAEAALEVRALLVQHRDRQHQLLLVEDNAIARTALARVLGMEGWSVITAVNGADGLAQMYGGLSPDVILTDYMMPRLDGVAMVGAIRQDESLPSPPAILVTAHDLPPERYTQFHALLKKPFDPRELQSLLGHLAHG